ncbi:MAG TPA: DUF4153 domain-containing protein [Rhizobiaceae bacterium]|nr:DUF4153 domain-containing protein [Rhizobiaceae bacterium]
MAIRRGMMTAGTATGLSETAAGWKAVLIEMLVGIWDAVARFPITALAILIFAVDANLLLTDSHGFWGGNEDLLEPLFAMAAASLAATLACEAEGANAVFRHGAALVAGLAAFAIAWWDKSFALSYWPFAAALVGLIFVAPIAGRHSGAACWLFGTRLVFAIFLSLLALLLFAGGISAILASLTYLFGFPVPRQAYEHVWTATGLLAAPLFGLGRIPRDFDSELHADEAKFAALGMRALGEFVAAPLLLTYAAILHLYALKILLTGDVPPGQIGWLVLAYGFCVFAALIVCHPFLHSRRPPTRLFVKLWPFTLPVPLILLFYALGVRVHAYGLTPQRFLLGLFAAAVIAILILQLSRRIRGDIRLLAALPALVLLIGSFGPQGAVATSIRNQAARFTEAVKIQPLDNKHNEVALSALRFLAAHDAVARVAPLAVAANPPKTGFGLFDRVADAYGIRQHSTGNRPNDSFSLTVNRAAGIASAGFDMVVPDLQLTLYNSNGKTVDLPSGKILTFALAGDAVTVSDGEMETRLPLDTAQLAAVVSARGKQPRPLTVTDGRHTVRLLPRYLYGETRPALQLKSFMGAVLLRQAEW